MTAQYERGSGRELAGLIIILIGFGLLINTMGIFPMIPFWPIIHRFWLPTLFIGIGLLLFTRRNGNTAGLFFILFGLLFLMGGLNLWPYNYRRWIGPGILIWIGMVFLMKNPNRTRRIRQHNVTSEETTDSSDFVHGSVFLGGINRKCVSQQFRGGDITAVMGGGKIDLREARIQGNEAVLDIFTLIGGIELLVPRDWVVEPRFTPVLGGFEDRTTPEKKESGTLQRLAIQGTTILGGITVSN